MRATSREQGISLTFQTLEHATLFAIIQNVLVPKYPCLLHEYQLANIHQTIQSESLTTQVIQQRIKPEIFNLFTIE